MQYGVQVLSRNRSSDLIYVSVMSRKDDSSAAGVVDVFSGRNFQDLEYEVHDGLGNDQFPLYVIMPDGTWEAPDCLSTWEALEATYADAVWLTASS